MLAGVSQLSRALPRAMAGRTPPPPPTRGPNDGLPDSSSLRHKLGGVGVVTRMTAPSIRSRAAPPGMCVLCALHTHLQHPLVTAPVCLHVCPSCHMCVGPAYVTPCRTLLSHVCPTAPCCHALGVSMCVQCARPTAPPVAFLVNRSLTTLPFGTCARVRPVLECACAF